MFIEDEYIPKPYVKTDWPDSKIKVSNDHLFINGELVMNKDELPIMKALSKIVGEHGGDIVETGYGMGISAKLIDSYPKVKSHTIIEANKQVYQTLVDYKNTSSTPVSIIPVLDFFEDWIKTVPDNSYDGVFYDTFPLEVEDVNMIGPTYTRKVYQDIFRILKPGGVFTYFGSWEMKDGDTQHLIHSGFKPDNIYFDSIKVETYQHQQTYPLCETREDIYIVPKIIK